MQTAFVLFYDSQRRAPKRLIGVFTTTDKAVSAITACIEADKKIYGDKENRRQQQYEYYDIQHVIVDDIALD